MTRRQTNTTTLELLGPALRGYCPMGCGPSLFLGDGGHITCSLSGCPRPDAAALILSDSETEHVVLLGAETFSIRHPLRERIDGELFDCRLHQELAEADGPPRQPGCYRATRDGIGWRFTRLDTTQKNRL